MARYKIVLDTLKCNTNPEGITGERDDWNEAMQVANRDRNAYIIDTQASEIEDEEEGYDDEVWFG